MNKFLLHATCGIGMETMLKREVTMLGFEEAKADVGYVSFFADEREVLKANLYLRTAERVLLKIIEFGAKSFDTLFDKVKEFPWENFLPMDACFNVSKITSVNSVLYSKRDSQKIIKKAIVDRMKASLGVEVLSETGSEYEIYVKIIDDRVQLFFNTSGEGLHKRGYRPGYGDAPLRETIAAGLVLLGGYRRAKYLIDPMCGSGTIVIEAAMFAANIPPGINRSFAYEKWGILTKDEIALVRNEAKAAIVIPETKIYGYDIDEDMIDLAKENAANAGVEDLVKFKVSDMSTFASPIEGGILITNPPYGMRMKPEDAKRFYSGFSHMLCRLKSFKALIISADENFEELMGLKATKARKTQNSNLPAKIYIYEDTKNIKKVRDNVNENKRPFGSSTKKTDRNKN